MNNYDTQHPVSDAQRSTILASLNTNGLTVANGIISWINPATGELEPVDPSWFLSCGIDLRININPMTLDESEKTTREIVALKMANDRIRDDTRGNFVFLILNQPGSTAVAHIDYATLT